MAPARSNGIDYRTARALRDLCVRQAWHAVNSAGGYDEDAEDDLQAIDESIDKLSHLSSRILEHARELARSCAWRATLQRVEEGSLGEGYIPQASPYISSAQAGKAAEAAKSVHRRFAPSNEDLYKLANSAAWFTANHRSGYHDDASRDIVTMCRAFDRLYRIPRPKWAGVNLGGWLVLERGPSAPFYEANGIPGDSGEWDATLALSEGHENQEHARKIIMYHRRRHVTALDFKEIAARGFNAVRVPFGYWIVTGPTHGDPYIGPNLELLDCAVRWAGENGLQVLLDLHGNPGGETEEKPCGRQNDNWCFEDWRRDEALEILSMLAERYKSLDHVVGFQVCNEPSRTRIEPVDLMGHYRAAVAAVRAGGMTPERVAVVCPCHYIGVARRVFLEAWRESMAAGELDGAVLDFHPYFFDPTANEVTQGLVSDQARREAEVLDLVPAAVVGEFSAAFHTFKGEPCEDKSPEGRALLNEFLRVQQEAYSLKATHGHFYWNWSDGAVGWSRQAAYLDGPDALPLEDDGVLSQSEEDEYYADEEHQGEESDGDSSESYTSNDSIVEAMEATSPYSLRNKERNRWSNKDSPPSDG
mmetsp:Transcript_27897/g.85165  ORF Transcript_27897/g.85165 Transcript_27897/m.85165 type:complete len:588 (+) Transcript_27897:192-1955(+)